MAPSVWYVAVTVVLWYQPLTPPPRGKRTTSGRKILKCIGESCFRSVNTGSLSDSVTKERTKGVLEALKRDYASETGTLGVEVPDLITDPILAPIAMPGAIYNTTLPANTSITGSMMLPRAAFLNFVVNLIRQMAQGLPGKWRN